MNKKLILGLLVCLGFTQNSFTVQDESFPWLRYGLRAVFAHPALASFCSGVLASSFLTAKWKKTQMNKALEEARAKTESADRNKTALETELENLRRNGRDQDKSETETLRTELEKAHQNLSTFEEKMQFKLEEVQVQDELSKEAAGRLMKLNTNQELQIAQQEERIEELRAELEKVSSSRERRKGRLADAAQENQTLKSRIQELEKKLQDKPQSFVV